MEKGSDLLKKVFLHHYEHNETQHVQLIKRYMEAMEVDLDSIQSNSNDEIRKRVNRWDTARWKEETEQKSTLRLYRKYKTEIEEVKWFDNT